MTQFQQMAKEQGEAVSSRGFPAWSTWEAPRLDLEPHCVRPEPILAWSALLPFRRYEKLARLGIVFT